MAGVKENTLTNISSGNVASFKSVGSVPLKSLKVNFNPIQEGDGDPSPSNIRPITGWTKLDIFHSNSKNILDSFNNPIWQNSGVYSVNQSGEVTVTGSDGRGWINTQINPLNLKKGTYTISYTGGGNCNLRTSIDDYNTNYSTTNGHLTFTLIKDAGIKFKFSGKTYPATFSVQIEPGFINHSYESYKSFTTIPVSWESTEEIYGGYVDPIKGKLVASYLGVKIPLSAASKYTTEKEDRDGYVFSDIDFGGRILTNNKQKSNLAKYQYETWKNGVVNHFYAYSRNNNLCNIQLALQKNMDENTILEIYAEAEIPIEYDIDPITINSLIGQNNIWSTADTVETEYYFLESLDVYKQRFKANEPHLESSIGNIANFTTDMVSPLKSAKFNFLPVQASGNPSPDNILPISGWNRIAFDHTDNLWDGKYEHGKLDNSGAEISANVEYRNVGYIPVTPDSTIRIKYISTPGAANIRLYRYNNGKEYITNTWVGPGSITLSSDTYYIRFYTDTAYSNNYNGGGIVIEYISSVNSNALTFPSTVYGGYIDAITGEIWATWAKKVYMGDYTGGSVNNYSTYIRFVLGRPYFENPPKNNSKVFFNYLKSNSTSVPWNGFVGSTGNVLIYLPLDYDTKGKANAYFAENNLEICYELETPMLIDVISPTQIKALKGLNNIWSNTNDTTEIKYWTHGNLATRKKIVWNQWIQNGDFSNGTDGWTSSATLTVNNNIVTLYNSEITNGYKSLNYNNSITSINNHKYIFLITIQTKAGKICIIPTSATAEGSSGYHIYEEKTAIKYVWNCLVNKNITYEVRCWTGSGITSELEFTAENIMLIDLTQMFGEGNEPSTAEEFEFLCTRNGINLTQYQPYNEGTELYWYM